MAASVIWSPSARGDLRSIVSYIALDNPDAALATGRRIIACSKQIEEFGDSARVVPEFKDRTIREILVGPYRIIFRLKSGRVEVVRVWHAARGRPEL